MIFSLFLDYFTSHQNPYHEDLVHTQQKLQTDCDKDVRFFSSLQPGSDSSIDADMVRFDEESDSHIDQDILQEVAFSTA